MNRQQFLRLLVATPVLTGLGFLFGQPSLAKAPAKAVAPQTTVEQLRHADQAVDMAYDKCVTGNWAPVYQREYLQAALKAARTYERHDPDNAYGQNYYRLVVDIATDVKWDPRMAKREDVQLIRRAAEFTRGHHAGDQHVARSTALLKKIRQQGPR